MNNESQLILRLATSADARTLAKLRYELRSTTGIATEREISFLDRCSAWMEEHLRKDSRWKCWIAESRGELIGCLWLQLVEKIPNPRAEAEHHAYLTNFYVQESVRGRGVGSQLLNEAI